MVSWENQLSSACFAGSWIRFLIRASTLEVKIKVGEFQLLTICAAVHPVTRVTEPGAHKLVVPRCWLSGIIYRIFSSTSVGLTAPQCGNFVARCIHATPCCLLSYFSSDSTLRVILKHYLYDLRDVFFFGGGRGDPGDRLP